MEALPPYRPILRTLAATLLVVCSAVAFGSARAADIVFRAQASPQGALVYLGDLATVTDADPAVAERLSALPLMPAPAPGTRSTVTAQGIRELIVASGGDLNRLRFDGAIRIELGSASPLSPAPAPAAAPKTFVEPAAPARASRQRSGFRRAAPSTTTKRPTWRPVPAGAAAKMTDELQSQIAEFARQQTGDAMLQALAPEVEPRHLSLLSGATTPVSISTTNPVLVGRQRFLVSFDSSDGPVRFPVFADVRPATPAVFLRRAVPRGATITRADVELQPLPVDSSHASSVLPLARLEDAIGKEASTSLRSGSLLTESNCLPPMLVRRGEEVTVAAGGGGVLVRLQAKARSNGRLGDIVPVETYDRRGRLMARVVGPRELAVLSSARVSTASLLRTLR